MKRLVAVTMLTVVAASAFALRKDPEYLDARRSGALARMQIHIVDDLGHDVPDAEVNVFMGMNFRPQGHYLKGVTDTKGIYVAEGKTCGDEVVIDVAKRGLSYAERLVRVVDRNGDPHTTKIPFVKDSALVTRTRCVIDEEGKIKAANYGCIRRFEIGPSRRGVALLRLTYVFNPTSNDTNLEAK